MTDDLAGPARSRPPCWPPCSASPTRRRRQATKICRHPHLGRRRRDAEAGVAARRGGRGRRLLSKRMSKDMDITGLFQVLDPASFPPQLQSEGLAFSSALWTQVGAQAVIKMKASGGQLEGRVYVVARGDQATLTKSYRNADIRDAVHEFANDIVAVLHRQTGRVRLAHRLRDERPEPHEIGVRRHGRRANGGADEDGIGQPAAGVFARRRGGRVHVLRAQQPRSLDRLRGRRARAAGVEAARPEHGRVVVARRAQHRADAVARGQRRDLPDQRRGRARAGAADATARPSTARRRSRRTARRSRSCRTGRARRRSS